MKLKNLIEKSSSLQTGVVLFLWLFLSLFILLLVNIDNGVLEFKLLLSILVLAFSSVPGYLILTRIVSFSISKNNTHFQYKPLLGKKQVVSFKDLEHIDETYFFNPGFITIRISNKGSFVFFPYMENLIQSEHTETFKEIKYLMDLNKVKND